ncbi:MAG: rubredoxin [Planctomycetes bacterium]|nr:rubredoxin [Planctomycetota bacterium]
MKKYVCGMCGWEYDPEQGFPVFGAKPGTPFEDLPDDFCCPVCGARKANFLPKELPPGGASPGARAEPTGDTGC